MPTEEAKEHIIETLHPETYIMINNEGNRNHLMVLKKKSPAKHTRRVASRRASVLVKGWRNINPTDVQPRSIRFPCKLVSKVCTISCTRSESEALYYSDAELKRMSAEFKQDAANAQKGLVEETEEQTLLGLEAFVDPLARQSEKRAQRKQAVRRFVTTTPAA